MIENEKLYFCPECGALVKRETAKIHSTWHTSLALALETLMPEPLTDYPTLKLVKVETNA